MILFIRDVGAALSSEILKTRRTLALGLAFLAPLLIIGLEFLIILQRTTASFSERFIPPGRLWHWA
jgi:hypothetical protein